MNTLLKTDYDYFIERMQHNELKNELSSINSTLQRSNVSLADHLAEQLHSVNDSVNHNLEDLNLTLSTLDFRMREICDEIAGVNDTIMLVGGSIFNALEGLTEAIANKRKTEANELSNMSRKLLSLKEEEKALSLLDEAITIDPLNFPAHFTFAEYYYSKQNYDKALEFGLKSMDRIDELQDSSRFLYTGKLNKLLYTIYDRKQEFSIAYEHLIKHIRTEGNIEVGNLYLVAKYAVKAKRPTEKVITVIRELIKRDKKFFNLALIDPEFNSIKKDIEAALFSIKKEVHDTVGILFKELKKYESKIYQRVQNAKSFPSICKPQEYEPIDGKRVDYQSLLSQYEEECTKVTDQILGDYHALVTKYENATYALLLEHEFVNEIMEFETTFEKSFSKLFNIVRVHFANKPSSNYITLKSRVKRHEEEIKELKRNKLSAILSRSTLVKKQEQLTKELNDLERAKIVDDIVYLDIMNHSKGNDCTFLNEFMSDLQKNMFKAIQEYRDKERAYKFPSKNFAIVNNL